MGNQLTKDNSFPLAQLPAAKFDELTSDSYTVIRTSGEEQTGFRIPRAGHYCKEGNSQVPGWEDAHAWDGLNDSQRSAKEQDAGLVHLQPYAKWKVHLVKFQEPPNQNYCDVCGWRTMMPDNGINAPKPGRTFWPTRLTTLEEREVWWSEMDALLRTLKRSADLSPQQRADINASAALRDEEVNGPHRRTLAAEEGDEYRSAERAAAAAAAAAEDRAEMASRHAWWAALDAEAAELRAAIKADKEAEGLSPEAATTYAKSVAEDMIGEKQRSVIAATPPGAPRIWPQRTLVQFWRERYG